MRVEIGGGPAPRHPDYVQVDALDWKDRTGLDYVIADARVLPFEDGAFEHVYSSNLLEHFPTEETTVVLTEWTRVLAIGGTLEVVVPDSLGILTDYFSGVNCWEDCAERLRGSGDYEGNIHRCAFTLATFPEKLARIPGLRLITCEASHAGGGVHSVSVKEG